MTQPNPQSALDNPSIGNPSIGNLQSAVGN
jgi:hypothetical protein